MEVEEMINNVREEQGRLFDMRQLTASCVANIIMNMLYGYRFDHSDQTFQQYISIVHEQLTSFSWALRMLPFLRFLPYFNKYINRNVNLQQTVTRFIDHNIATCIDVCIFIFAYCFVTQFATLFCVLTVVFSALS